jgi:hypothetical protein
VEQLVADHYKTIQIPPDIRQAMLGMLDEEFAALHASSETERHQLTVERDRIQDQRRASLQAHYAGALPLDLLKDVVVQVHPGLVGAESVAETTRSFAPQTRRGPPRIANADFGLRGTWRRRKQRDPHLVR